MSRILLPLALAVFVAAAAFAGDDKKPEKCDPQKVIAKQLKATPPATGQQPSAKPDAKQPEIKRPPEKRIIARPGVRMLVKPLAVRPEEIQAPRRKRIVYHVKHVPAMDLARTVGGLLESEPQAAAAPATKSLPVAMVADPITNSLLISAAPAALEPVLDLIKGLDRRPQMVSIEALIAEVSVGPTDDDSDPVAMLDELRAPVSDKSLQDLATALAKRPGVRLVARPRIAALSNQPASFQVGRRVPRIIGINVTSMGRSSSARSPTGRTNQVQLEKVGLSLGFTARVGADGLVTMEIDLEHSHLGLPEEGAPIYVPKEGPATYAQGVEQFKLRTTVSAASGQTVILGGTTARKGAAHSELIVLLSPRIAPTK